MRSTINIEKNFKLYECPNDETLQRLGFPGLIIEDTILKILS